MKSMTGYGKAIICQNNKTICVEIKTINSKTADVSLCVDNYFHSEELAIINILKTELIRGKIDCKITFEDTSDNEGLTINEDIFIKYYKQLSALCDKIGADKSFIAQYLLKREDVQTLQSSELILQDRQLLNDCLFQAIQQTNDYRQKEGVALQNALLTHIELIEEYLLQIEPFEQNRVKLIKEKLINALNDLHLEQIDNNRLEQELIYYLEKLDITEEKVRLRQHINYFRQTLQEDIIGKKINFIAQELGREINTLGSKSNQADMQTLVVKMKDELEKIKEQSANVL